MLSFISKYTTVCWRSVSRTAASHEYLTFFRHRFLHTEHTFSNKLLASIFLTGTSSLLGNVHQSGHDFLILRSGILACPLGKQNAIKHLRKRTAFSCREGRNRASNEHGSDNQRLDCSSRSWKITYQREPHVDLSGLCFGNLLQNGRAGLKNSERQRVIIYVKYLSMPSGITPAALLPGERGPGGRGQTVLT